MHAERSAMADGNHRDRGDARPQQGATKALELCSSLLTTGS